MGNSSTKSSNSKSRHTTGSKSTVPQQIIPPPINRIFFLGVELGQRRSYTAIVLLERFDALPSHPDMLRGKDFHRRYVVRQAGRVPLGHAPL